MINMSGYSFNEPDNMVDDTVDLRINSAGHYKMINLAFLETTRPQGRLDYQLLYVAKGGAYFQKDCEYIFLSEGTVVVYYPNDIQFYYYTAKDASDVYWVHFTGINAADYLSNTGFASGGFYSVTVDNRCISCFNQIIREQQLKKTNFLELSKSYFIQILLLMNRSIKEPITKYSNHTNMIDNTILYFQECYNHPISIQQLAKENHMTPSWFSHCFQDYCGNSPQEYLLNLRIEKAKDLLLNNKLSMVEISNLIGYTDHFYFSRIFKRKTGLSPLAYRKKF